MVHSVSLPEMSKSIKRRMREDGSYTPTAQVYSVSMKTLGWVRHMHELSEDYLRAMVHAILHALLKTHDAKLVHRDIRPDNILWQSDTQPFLADLELAAKQDLILHFMGPLNPLPYMQCGLSLTKRWPLDPPPYLPCLHPSCRRSCGTSSTS